MTRHARVLFVAWALVTNVACGSPPTPEIQNSGDPALAVGTAAAAAAMWAAAGGCNLQGCPYGSHCNKKTGFCDVTKCDVGCPDGTVCNEGLGLCQTPPAAQGPSDRLPQDDKMNRLPGQ